MSAVECETSFRPLGIALRIWLHLQVHAATNQGGRVQLSNGVRVHMPYNTNRIVLISSDRRFSFEDALLSPEPNLIMTQILSRFVLNLRPGTRNLRCAWFHHISTLVIHVSPTCPAPQLGRDIVNRGGSTAGVPQDLGENCILG